MKQFKEVLAAILTLAIIIVPPIIGGTIERTYSMTAKVISTDFGTIAIVDEMGEVWAFAGDGFTIGDRVKVRFDTNGTDSTREDDRVEKVKKF